MIKKNTFLSISAFAAVACMTNLASAAFTVEWNTDEPTTNIISSYDPATVVGGNNWYNYVYGASTANRVVAQTFTLAANANDYSVTAFSLKLQADTVNYSASAGISISFYKLDSASPVTANPIGTLISTQTGSIQPSAGTGTANSTFTFTFDEPIILDTSADSTTAYSIVMSFVNPTASGNYQKLNLQYGANTAGSRAVQQTDGGAWTYLSGGPSFVYFLEGNEVSAVPEPAAAAMLMSLSVGLIAFVVKRRRS